MIDLAEFAVQAEEGATPVARSSDLHGPRHWRDVARVAHAALVAVPPAPEEVNPEVVFMFAATHDTQRLSDDYDPEHGARAAEWASENVVGLTGFGTNGQPKLTQLCRAMVRHDAGRTHWDATIGLCWDADRLTLPRVGITPHEEFFSVPFIRDGLESWVEAATNIREGADLTWKEIADGYENLAYG